MALVLNNLQKAACVKALIARFGPEATIEYALTQPLAQDERETISGNAIPGMTLGQVRLSIGDAIAREKAAPPPSKPPEHIAQERDERNADDPRRATDDDLQAGYM